MLVAYFSPLAPAAILLLGAFILPLLVALVTARWQTSTGLRYLVASGVVEVAILFLFGIRLTLGEDVSGQGLELLSGWSFAAPETVAALMVRIDELSLLYLILTLMVLLVATLAAPSFLSGLGNDRGDVSSWLALGAGACLVFVSANGLTLSYAVLVFDAAAVVYWLRRGHYDMGVARLLLSLFTVLALVLVTLTPTTGLVSGVLLLSLALWLRLGLYPFFEANTYHGRRSDYEFLPYLSLSLLVTVYLALRIPVNPLPELVSWLVVLLMLFNGLQAWLAGAYPAPGRRPYPVGESNDGEALEQGQKTPSTTEEAVGLERSTAAVEEQSPANQPEMEPGLDEQRPPLLIPLVLTEALLILLVLPSGQVFVTASITGLILSLVALWITPCLGPPRFSEGAWLWPYLPATAATLTLIGLPFSLGWNARTSLYRSLFASEGSALTFIALLAEVFALSVLIRYWFIQWRGNEKDGRRFGVAVVVMVPFLIPGLAPLILGAITRTELAAADFNQPPSVILALASTVVAGTVLGYFRDKIILVMKISPVALAKFIRLGWLISWGNNLFRGLGRVILRVQIVAEGQHYMGWMLFTALIGALIVLLSYY